MAKRKPSIDQPVHTDQLIKTRKTFTEELSKRLEIGQELLDRKLSSHNDLAASKDDFNYWDDYNTELLKQSFDRPNNDYHRDYTYTAGPSVYFLGGSDPTLPELIREHKSDIKKQLKRLKEINNKVELIQTTPPVQTIQNSIDEDDKAAFVLNNLFSKFHRIAQTLRNRYDNRTTIIIKDEYDVQDLIRALLRQHFTDVRDEDYVPSYAGSNSRVDFVLKSEKIVIEIKITSDKLKDKELGNQLLIDIARYKNHPDCKHLYLFIYDKGDYILNKPGLIRDLNEMSTSNLMVKTFINPD